MKHKSVLLNEVIEYLNLKQGGKYIDATVGYGGHSSHILKEIGKEGVLFAFDQDDEAISYSTKRLSKIGDNFTIFKSNFVNSSLSFLFNSIYFFTFSNIINPH